MLSFSFELPPIGGAVAYKIYILDNTFCRRQRPQKAVIGNWIIAF